MPRSGPAPTSRQAGTQAGARTLGLAAGIALLAVTLVAYFAGGYVAGRMARFNGLKQGLGVWLWAIIAAVVLAVLTLVAGARFDALSNLNAVPQLPISNQTAHHGRHHPRRRPGRPRPGRGTPRRPGRDALPPPRRRHPPRHQRRHRHRGCLDGALSPVPLSRIDAERIAGTRGVVRDTAGGVVGSIVSVLLEEGTGKPSWVSVDRLGSHRGVFIPLADAWVDGTDIVLPYPKTVVDQAPPAADSRQLDPADELVLQTYYDSERAEPVDVRPAGPEPSTTGSMTRSEERLRVGVRVRPRERVRIVRHVVAEDVTFTVPVQREELRIERIPFDEDEDDDDARHGTTGPAGVGEHAFDQDGIDIVLHEERVVWSTEVVAVERVSLRVHTRTQTAEVSADLHAENLELVQDPPSGS